MCCYSLGGLKDVGADELLASALQGVCVRANIPLAEVDELVVGNVLQPGGGAIVARLAAFEAGFPVSLACMTVNRQVGAATAVVTIALKA